MLKELCLGNTEFFSILLEHSKTMCSINDVSDIEFCGEDGHTYSSLCHMHQAKVQMAYRGKCSHACGGKKVCGSDGITYPSACHARSHGIRVDYPGRCITDS